MKYYMIVELDVVVSLGKGKKLPIKSMEITKEQYDEYRAILKSIPDKEGYAKNVTLFVDGTYTVEYIPVETEEE